MSDKLSKENPAELSAEEFFNEVSLALASKDPTRIHQTLSKDVTIVDEPAQNQPKEDEQEKVILVAPSGTDLNKEEEEGKETKEEVSKEVDKEEKKVEEDPFGKKPEPTKEPPSAKDGNKPSVKNEQSLEALQKELEAVKKERDTYKHKFDSNAGRISAFQNTIADLRNQIALLQSVRPPKADDKDEKSSLKPIKENPHLAKLREVDPDLAGILENLLEDSRNQLLEATNSKVSKVADAAFEGSRQSYVAEQQAIVRQYIPDVAEVTGSKEFAHFFEKVATPKVKALLVSEEAEDALIGMGAFFDWAEAVGVKARPDKKEEEPKKQEETKPTKTQEELEQEKKLLESRDRKLKVKDASSDVPASQKPQASLDNETDLFWAAFKKRSQELKPTKR